MCGPFRTFCNRGSSDRGRVSAKMCVGETKGSSTSAPLECGEKVPPVPVSDPGQGNVPFRKSVDAAIF